MTYKKLKNKIIDKSASIGVIGLGYVGLPLAIRFSEEGFQTFGFEKDKSKIDYINDGKSYIKHINDSSYEKTRSYLTFG